MLLPGFIGHGALRANEASALSLSGVFPDIILGVCDYRLLWYIMVHYIVQL